MRIGIIGAGHLGSTLAHLLARLGADVRIANSRGPDTLGAVAAWSGARPASCADAVQHAELVILSIPFGQIASLSAQLLERRAPGAPVVDTTNYVVQRDGRIEALLDGSCATESEWVQERLGTPVVKAFSSMMARHLLELPRPYCDPRRLALPVFGDDAVSKRLVAEVVEALGFDAVDAGALAQSWRAQVGTPAFCTDLPAPALVQALAAATVDQSEAYRDAVLATQGTTRLHH